MKKIYTLIVLLVAAASVTKADNIKAKANASWNSSSAWDKNRVPANNDTVEIPAGYTISVSSNISVNNVMLKISGRLDLTDNGKLNLNNASEIYIYTGGILTGDGSNDQLIIGNTIVFKGSWADVKGPKIANNTTGEGFLAFAILPVKFVNFYVSKYNNDVRLNWATASETNNNHFEIEKSLDGSNWNAIALVFGAGTSTSTNTYSYTDKNVTAKVVYYRIKQIDNNGAFTYTSIKTIKADEAKSTTQIYASNSSIVVKFSESKESVTVRVLNMNGQLMQQQTVQQAGTMVAMNANFKQGGVYVVQVTDSSNNSEGKKIML